MLWIGFHNFTLLRRWAYATVTSLGKATVNSGIPTAGLLLSLRQGLLAFCWKLAAFWSEFNAMIWSVPLIGISTLQACGLYRRGTGSSSKRSRVAPGSRRSCSWWSWTHGGRVDLEMGGSGLWKSHGKWGRAINHVQFIIRWKVKLIFMHASRTAYKTYLNGMLLWPFFFDKAGDASVLSNSICANDFVLWPNVISCHYRA